MTPRRGLFPVISALVGLGLLAAAGCASDRTGRAADNRVGFNTGLPLEPGHAQEAGYSTRWVRGLALGRGQSVYAAAPLGDLLVVVERPDNIVSAVRLGNGELAWKTSVGDRLEDLFAPVADDENVYVISNNRLFTLMRRNGRVTDIANLPGYAATDPCFAEGRVVYGSVDGVAIAYDPPQRLRAWSYALERPVLATPIVDGDQVFVADIGGHYAMLKASSGALRWRGQVYGAVTATPHRDRTQVIVAGEDQSLYALASNTGEFNWPAYRSEVRLTEPPVVFDEVVYLTEPGVGLTALDANTGRVRWQRDDAPRPLALHDGRLVAVGDNQLLHLGPADGRTRQAVPLKDLAADAPLPDGGLVLIGEDGLMLRIDPN
ncbi:MAG: PQQ-binding-like beta-propeller repeat protein [Planctomycetota bacterium]